VFIVSNREIDGRFLPSRVYRRWKWAVRLGLLVIPFVILLSGGLTLFLSPNKYRSTTVFSIDQGPGPAEVAHLVKSSSTLEQVTRGLELPNRWNVDSETVHKIVRGITATKILPDTPLVEITVTHTNKIDARDIAQMLPESVHAGLMGISRDQSKVKADEIALLIDKASDTARESAAVLSNLEKVHGATPSDNAAARMLERARRDSLLADAEVERLRTLHTARLTEDIDSLPSLQIHTRPTISDTAFSPKIASDLNLLALRSLGWGLLVALLAPYLSELAFPRRMRSTENPDAVSF
jgi:capsular polysaccharide biosynthesis protein